MASTAISSMVIRLITTEHMAAEMPSLSQLIASGAVTVDPNTPAKAGGNYLEIPEFMEYTTADVVIPDDDTDGTRNALATAKDVGVVCRRENGIGVKDSAEIASGEDINAEALAQAPGYWAKRMNIALYNVLKGCFASALSGSNHVYDAAAPFTRTAIPEVMRAGAVGDQWDKYSIWVMRGVQFAQAFADGIVNYVNAGAFGERLLTTGQIPTIAGKQVVVDDNIVETDGSTYLLQPNALYLGFQSPFRVETQRDASIGGGIWEHWFRAHFIPHCRRTAYQTGAGTNPTNTVLATGSSWSLTGTAAATDPKLVKVFKVKFAN